MIWGCASPPMAPTRCVSAPGAVVTSMGERVWGGRRPGRDLGGMALDEREAHAAVVEEDARRRLDEVGAEVEGVGLRERDPETVRVHGAQVRRVPLGDPGHRWARRALAGRDVRRRHPLGARRRAPAAARRSGSSSAPPSAPSKSTSGRSWPTARHDSTRRCAQRGSSGSVPSPAAAAT